MDKYTMAAVNRRRKEIIHNIKELNAASGVINLIEISQLKNNPLFKGLTRTELKEILSVSEIKTFSANEYIINEGDQSDEIYIIVEGHIRLIKYDNERNVQVLADLFSYDNFGEMSFLDGAPRSCGAIAMESTSHLVLKKTNITSKKILNKLFKNIAAQISNKLKVTNNSYVESLQKQIYMLRDMIHFGRIFIVVALILGLANIFIEIFTHYQTGIDIHTAAFSWAYLLIMLIPISYVVIRNPEPLSTYGITFTNLKQSLLESGLLLLIITPVMLRLLGFNLEETLLLFSTPVMLNYLAHCFIQEFIARGILQTALYKFLYADNITPIFLAAFIFSIFHIQFGLQAVFLTFISGILFGYLFYRQKNLIGVTLVHFVLGWIALGRLV